jgi:NADH-ubiquinone oxidoreductase chain 5
LFIGYLTRDLFIGFGTNFWGAAIFVAPKNYLLTDVEFISLFYKLLPLIFTLFGMFFAYFIYSFDLDLYFKLKTSKKFKYFYNFFNKKWYFDRIYNEFISQNVLYYSYYFSYQDIDRGVLEVFGPYGFVKNLENLSFYIKYYQSGNIFHYLFIFSISLIFISFFFLVLFKYKVLILLFLVILLYFYFLV